MKNQTKAYIYAGLATIFWGTSASAFKIGLKEIDHLQLLFVAAITSFVFLIAVIAIQGRIKELFSYSRKQYFNSVLLGILNPFLYYVIVLKAYSLLPAQLAQPLNFIWPITLVLLSIPILKQKVSGKNMIAMLISFVGVYFIASKGNLFNFEFANPFGVALAMGSSIIWALFWLLNVKDKRDEISKLLLGFFFALIFISIVVYKYSSFSIASTKGILAGVYVGFFEMGITFVIWLKALQLSKSTDKIGNMIYLTPFFALLFIILILGEQIYYTTVIGIILIVGGLIWQQRSKIKEVT